MMQALLNLPKTLLVCLLLGGGTLAIVILNPPYTVCDSQLEVFKKNQVGFLYLPENDKISKTTHLGLLTSRCRETNAPGGCYELFMKTKRLLGDLDAVSQECHAEVTSLEEVRKALWGQLTLMIRLAWGSKPPTSYYEKVGWLDSADLGLFCRLLDVVQRSYGSDALAAVREDLLVSLPGAKEQARTKNWEMLLLSLDCKQYP